MATVRAPRRVEPLERLRLQLTLCTLLCSLALGLVALLVVYPIVLLLINSFQVGPFGRETHWGVENWYAAVTEPRSSALLGTP